LDLKKRFGFWDPRLSPEMENCDICANDLFRNTWKDAGVNRKAFDAPPAMGKAKSGGNGQAPADAEALIQTITDRVMAAMKN
jgi:L-fuculose-phosphate aldolase